MRGPDGTGLCAPNTVASPIDAASVQPAVYVLAGGVTGFRVTYLSRAGAWRESWPSLKSGS